MRSSLNQEQREQITVAELARLVFRLVKGIEQDMKKQAENRGNQLEGPIRFSLPHLQKQLCAENEVQGETKDPSFFLKFYEAIAQLKRRGLLMDALDPSYSNRPCCCFTSLGEKSDDHNGILILFDDAHDIVKSLKENIPNLDYVVGQYYLESLRTCQEGSYISSVICLGGASERAINCLAEAVIRHDAHYQEPIGKHQSISALTGYLSDNVNQIFKPITDSTFRSELRDKLEGIARIYRLNRNEAGHPKALPQDWQRDEQECYLNQFRRFVLTVFKVIDILDTT